ncbi:tubulin binding cofactor A-domain-containing protein [Ochromonadaceae sp. CCMP2298]|nr:tubulin binding cofactor A-domain-containing protein [Ochromonadaceae sp. CCMP2298]|mmetsp:Transcript_11133/g.24938  ORF Transcript_11133/g.24938 Transcript_11133/m.24938 type:complete len:134 (+) Transcript_11133:96-497(+)
MATRSSREAVPKTASKQLQIQLGICKRMVKEVDSYEKEVIVNEGRIQKMNDDGKDPYDIRKQEEVLQESYMMIPDSKARLEKTILDLMGMVEEMAGNAEVEGTLLAEAHAMIAQNAIVEEEILHEEVGEDEEL